MRENVPSLITSRRLLATFVVVLVFSAVLALSAFSSTAEATHSWNDYHWGRTSSSFTLQLGDNVDDTKWLSYLRTTASSVQNQGWGYSTKLDTNVVAGRSKGNCQPTSGRVEVCNKSYGQNGWLGLAQIWISGGHIVQGVAKMNDTYFDTAYYNNSAWKNHVMCQEVGHTFGLGHTSEDGSSQETCMDYSSSPNNSQYPNQHDYDQLDSIYSHTTDKTNTFSSTSTASRMPPAASQGELNSRADWGRLVHRSPNGQVEIYERDFGQGQKVVSRVIRVTDGTPALDTNGGGSGGGHNHADHEH